MTESTYSPETATYRKVVEAGDHWMHKISKGQTFRVLDLEGNQAADTLFYNADDPSERYAADITVRNQNALYLTTGTTLMSTEGNPLLTITADTCGNHDTVGGACSRESNTMRYSQNTEHMHACRDIFLTGMHEWGEGFGKRDIAVDTDAMAHLIDVSNGDARSLLNALELAVETTPQAPSI